MVKWAGCWSQGGRECNKSLYGNRQDRKTEVVKRRRSGGDICCSLERLWVRLAVGRFETGSEEHL